MAYIRYLAAFAAALAFVPAWPATPALTAIQSCAKVTDDKARLACFDRQITLLNGTEARSADTGGAATPAASGSSVADAGTKLTPEQKIGLPRGKVDRLEAAPGTLPEPPLAAFTAGIRSVSIDAGQRQVFVLDNDQVWRQSETKPRFSVRPGDTVRITRGALGAFWLSANPHSATRVSRVR
ncbi:MAG: hypothetical protein JWO52_7339 [Gammaproteobacteria bacterium]|jgi:hypothetical protein|nr:hypothetical protein [Gammaproteobacteria bacterium]